VARAWLHVYSVAWAVCHLDGGLAAVLKNGRKKA
jgi:hypothetical protein